MEEEIKDLKKRPEDQNNKLIDANNEKESLGSGLEDKEEIIRTKEEKIKILKKRLQDQNDKLIDANNEKESLGSDLEDKEEIIRTKEKEIKILKKRLQDQNERNQDMEKLHTALHEMNRKIESLQAQNQQCKGSEEGPEDNKTEMDEKVEAVKRKLRNHFEGGINKYVLSHKLPWNLFTQIFKMVLITIQLVMFGNRRITFVEYVESNNIAMKHLFLLHWTPDFETMPYPPTTGPYAIYTSNDLVDHINFAMKQFSHTESLTLGPIRFPDGGFDMAKYLYMCVEQCKEGNVLKNGTYSLDQHVIKDCLHLIPERAYNNGSQETETKFDIMAILKKNNKSLVFDRILKIELKFRLKSYRVSVEKAVNEPECYRIDGMVVFDNTNRNGQMAVHLSTSLKEFICGAEFDDVSTNDSDRFGIVLDIFVMILCVVSFSFCIRSFSIAYALFQHTVDEVKDIPKVLNLICSMKFEFVDLWLVLIIINDVLFVTGSIVKICLENKHAESSSENYDICALMLGIGCGLAFMGIIRYVAFFAKYNILTVVLKKAFPDLMKFLVTTTILYLGSLLCGWVVLGPYHIKFRHLSTASECLFSLINGDEMFTTFSATMTDNTVIWYFSRFYMYTFLVLFIYAATNLFIAVILGTYDIIKKPDFERRNSLQIFYAAEDDQNKEKKNEDESVSEENSCFGCFGKRTCRSMFEKFFGRKRKSSGEDYHQLEEVETEC
uniref:Mucolipin-3-like isoform X1 n=1 Tax=Crassostrea virginica TaxID=6565 RepID=A0A8B8EZX1_CRAVI|nr:mucolipin-3-like isoform X1 [Crassostrea virginica]